MPQLSNTPLFIRNITTYLRQLTIGSSAESYSVDENWKEFSISSEQYSQLIEYLKQQEESLWGFWQNKVKHKFYWYRNALKIGMAGKRY